MRPGLLCPGKIFSGMIRHRPQRSFNEAGAVMPRKGIAAVEEAAIKEKLQ